MTSRKKRIILVLSFIVTILLVLVILRFINAAGESSRRPAMIPNVVVSNPGRGEISRSISLTGDILPIQQANIYSKVSGNIEKIYVDIGISVRQGQVLAIIDTTIYSQNVRQALGVLMQAEANLQNAKVNLERNQSLFEQKLIAKQDVDNSKTTYDVSNAQREAANATYKNILTQLSYCKVTAPFSGSITKRFLDAGAYVTASTSAPSSTLFTIMDIDKVKVFANIPEKNVPDLSQVFEANIKIDAYPDETFKASIRRASEAIDLSTRTMQIEIDINNENHKIKPGMFANINLVLEKKHDVLILPINVVLKDDSGNFVYTVTKDTISQRKYVTIGIQQESNYEIVSGISDSDKVVVVGQSLIKDKMKVRLTR
jgi:RND family efflux transporter MFP subunit